MAVFNGHAKSLSQLYVFYDRLKTDSRHPKLGEYVSNACSRILEQTQKYRADSSLVRQQARSEFNKERALLIQKFGVDINFDYYNSPNDFKEVINALNSVLNLKEIYNRSVQLTKLNKGLKGVYTWYPTYFMQAWRIYWPKIKSRFEYRFKQGRDVAEVLEEIFDELLPEICVLGIKKMLDGPEVEAQGVDPALKDAYRDLISQIGEVQQSGSMANQIYKVYQLDKLKEAILGSLEISNGRIYASKIKPKVRGAISQQVHSRGGFSLEAIETAVFSNIADKLSKNPNIRVVGNIHSGVKEIKADNILTIDIDMDLITDALEHAGANREENIKALSELGTKIKNLDDGFIIYSSDKNQAQKTKKGFGAGSLGPNAQSFLENVYKNSSSVNTLIGAVQQLGKGAMMEDKEGAFEELLAQDVAYMLFDDYTSIGENDAGGKAIHVMNLNGILMPMSVILTLLADAIDSIESSGSKQIRKIVDVDINAPAILYNDDTEQASAHPGDPMAAWNEQRQYALDNTKIQATFLKNFTQIVSMYL